MGLWTVEKGPLKADCCSSQACGPRHVKNELGPKVSTRTGSLASCFYPFPARKTMSVSKNNLYPYAGLNSASQQATSPRPNLQGLRTEILVAPFAGTAFFFNCVSGPADLPYMCSWGLSMGWPSLPKHQADDNFENIPRNHATPWFKHRTSFRSDLNKSNRTQKIAQRVLAFSLISTKHWDYQSRSRCKEMWPK